MKRKIITLILASIMIFVLLPFTATDALAAESEYAWVLVDIIDYENAEKWAAADAHVAYIVKHSYSRGSYSASTTFEGEDIYDTGLGGTLAVNAEFSGIPDIIYPDKPVSLKFSFTTVEDTVNKLSFTASAAADFDRWDVGPGGVTGGSRAFKNKDGKSDFSIIGQQSVSYDETLSASLGTGSKNSRIALRLYFYFGTPMGTNYIYEWKQADDSAMQPTETVPEPAQTSKSQSNSYTSPLLIQREPTICRIGDLHGEVNVRPNDEDDDAYIFAEVGMWLYHNDRVKTWTRSGCIIDFSDMSSFIMKEDTTIVLDIASEKESKIALVAGNVWINLKNMIKDGSLEIEMSQAVAGIKATTLICEEHDGVSVLKVIEGTVVFTSYVTGEMVEVNSGQMVSADSTGLGRPAAFDIDAELKTWDEKTQQLTAEVLAGSKAGLNTGVVILIIIAVVLFAAVIVVIRIKRKKPIPSVSPAYPQTPVYQTSPVSNEKGYNSSKKFCGNCGAPMSSGSKFCAKCGKHLE